MENKLDDQILITQALIDEQRQDYYMTKKTLEKHAP